MIGPEELISGWRDLSIEVSKRLGRPVGTGKLRWVVENSGLPIGRRLGRSLIFDEDDMQAVVRLLEWGRL